jgi:hypothetical protein
MPDKRRPPKEYAAGEIILAELQSRWWGRMSVRLFYVGLGVALLLLIWIGVAGHLFWPF